MTWLAAARTRLRLLFDRRADESRMGEEFRFHLDMETTHLVTEEHLELGEARHRALVAFGGVERHKEALRDGRGLAWLSGMSLDVKLGFRMLVKYPGLTIVAGLAMAFAIWVSVVTFEMVTMFLRPTLPLPGGDRIVQIQNWDALENRAEHRASYDFRVWRTSLQSVTDVGAYRSVTRNLDTGDGAARPVSGAEVTATAFRIAPIPPLIGRRIDADDERPGAPPVVVIGYDVWRMRFASDPGVVGRTVRLGDEYATIIGVMPQGFAFPVAHELWTPLQPDVLDHLPREGPAIRVFGRLAGNVTLAQAQAELSTLGERTAGELPETHGRLQPQVRLYARSYFDPTPADLGMLLSIELFALMLLILVCGNVALLLFARAAARESELLVRSALGASRGRIVAQLFAEALVLGGVAAAVGLVAAHTALDKWAVSFLELNLGRLPFWYDPGLSPLTIVYALLLTVLGAAIAGAMPARKITRGLGPRLKEGTAGSGLRFGGVWTAVIVVQVAVTVVFPFAAFVEQRESIRIRSYDVGFAAEEYLGLRLEMESAPASLPDSAGAAVNRRERFAAALEAMRQRVAAEPGVSGVTFVDRLPRTFHGERRIELDDASALAAGSEPAVAPGPQAPSDEVSTAAIDPGYFEVLRAPVLEGRAFGESDLDPNARVVIVDEGFVARMTDGRSPVGRQLRFVDDRGWPGKERSADESRPWYEIVGVVKELGIAYPTHRHRTAGVYLPSTAGSAGPVHMIVHAPGDPLGLAPELHGIATEVDPALRLSNMQRLDRTADGLLWLLGLWLRVTIVLTSIALLLSLAGIYAVLSFTVSRRTREIGVRVALGASRRRVVAAIFRRPLAQVAAGVVMGGTLVALAAIWLAGSGLSATQVGLLTLYSAAMLGVCLLACAVPTRRALRVEPTEALRAE